MSVEEHPRGTPDQRPKHASKRLVLGQGMPDVKALGAFVRTARTEQRLSADDVAKAIDVTGSYVRAIERGERVPAPKVAANLFSALGFSVTEGSPLSDANLVVHSSDGDLIVEFKRWGRPSIHSPSPTDGQFERFLAYLEEPDRRDVLPYAATGGLPVVGVAITPTVVGGLGALFGRSKRTGDADAAPAAAVDVLVGRLVRRVARLDRESLELVAEVVDRLSDDAHPQTRRRLRKAMKAALVVQQMAVERAQAGSQAPEPPPDVGK